MDSKIAENIRAFRKERNLTQEQLAEAMGVTTGAVHKWEAGMSIPELGLIMELADFFDISVDVLLGYKKQDHKIDAIVERMSEYCKTLDRNAITEAEKALQKYPNSLKVVYASASVYLTFAIGKERSAARRALELLERALLLLPQNPDPDIGEVLIYGKMAGAYEYLGDFEKSIEILKNHNESGIFSADIGVSECFFRKHYDEAVPYLTQGLMNSFVEMTNSLLGWITVLGIGKKDYAAALDLAEWGLYNVKMLKKRDITDSLSKIEAFFLASKAGILLKAGRKKEARDAAKEAEKIVRDFDDSPDYGVENMRFAEFSEESSFHDGLGLTAEESMETMINTLGDKELIKLWKDVHNNGTDRKQSRKQK